MPLIHGSSVPLSSRAEWGQPGEPLKIPTAAARQLNGATLLFISGGISIVLGLILLFGAL